MALITFTSDYGESDFYVAAVKAKMLNINPQLNIVDISHHVHLFDVAHAAFLINATFREFPKGTVHLVAINENHEATEGFIGVKIEEHIFLGPNNGVLSLLSENQPGIMVQFADIHVKASTFPVKDVLAPIAAKVASGASIHDFGGPIQQIKKLLPRHLKATKKQIVGNVVRVDGYGNLITNISKTVFDQLNPGKFSIEFRKETITAMNTTYHEVDNGEVFVFFNSLGYLEIGINHGNGAQLLGLHFDSPVYINFETET
jgi:S-adenosyl-L-methionine hydrolase (adenosine-forming)